VRRLSVIVVSYNSADLLPRCLDSVLAQTAGDDEVVVVDNASADGSADLVRRDFPSVTVILSETNLGFGAGA
jgi:GT2 family glycosyltransferase